MNTQKDFVKENNMSDNNTKGEVVYDDIIFGKMKYRHSWDKEAEIMLFGRRWNIIVSAHAYSGQLITNEQRESYSRYFDEQELLAGKAEVALLSYVNEFLQSEIKCDSVKDLAKSVVPRTILFQHNGNVILLLDCVWDIEHGIAVQLLPSVVVGEQDMFL